MFMKNFSATLLIPSSIRESHREAGRSAMTRIDTSRRMARSGHVIDTIVASILRPRLG